jgi:hypothetical protein
MNLQQHYDLEVSKDLFEKQIKREIKPLVFPKNGSRARRRLTA